MATTDSTRTGLVRRPYRRSSKMAEHETWRAGSFGAQLKAFREAAGFTQEELATIAGLSVQAVSGLREPTPRERRVRCTSCLKPSARTRRLSSRRRASATTPRVSYAIAAVKPSSQRKAWLDGRRSRGWIVYAKIWRATAARSRAHRARPLH